LGKRRGIFEPFPIGAAVQHVPGLRLVIGEVSAVARLGLVAVARKETGNGDALGQVLFRTPALVTFLRSRMTIVPDGEDVVHSDRSVTRFEPEMV